MIACYVYIFLPDEQFKLSAFYLSKEQAEQTLAVAHFANPSGCPLSTKQRQKNTDL